MNHTDSGGRVVPLDAPAHQEVRLLLPWLVTGRLADADLERVRRHLADCPRCQADLEGERTLHAHYAALDSEADAERGLAAMRERLRRPARVLSGIERLHDAWAEARAGAGAAWRQAAWWLRGLLAAQAAAIAALCATLLLPIDDTSGPYRALGSPTGRAAQADAVVRFQPGTEERALRRALQASGARMVDGPTVSGAYLLSLPPASRRAALERLRADPAVLLAESLE